MQTGEVAKALGVHYNTAYNLAATGKVQVPKGDNGQYQWSQDHLDQAKTIMASRATRTRRPATQSAGRPGGVKVTSQKDQKVLALLAKLEGKTEKEYLSGLLQREAAEVRQLLG